LFLLFGSFNNFPYIDIRGSRGRLIAAMTAVAIMIAVGLISYFSDISLVLQIFKFHLDAPYVLMQKFSQLLNAVCFPAL
jgi:hypothetical protein